MMYLVCFRNDDDSDDTSGDTSCDDSKSITSTTSLIHCARSRSLSLSSRSGGSSDSSHDDDEASSDEEGGGGQDGDNVDVCQHSGFALVHGGSSGNLALVQVTRHAWNIEKAVG